MAHIHEGLTKFSAGEGGWEMYEGGQSRRLLFGIVSTPEDIAKSPQLKFRKWLTPVEDPNIGETLEYPGPPYRLSETPWAIRSRPPMLKLDLPYGRPSVVPPSESATRRSLPDNERYPIRVLPWSSY